MNTIPIKIDLSIFFTDERRKVLLMFNPEWKTVGCLQKRVEALFGLNSLRLLSEDGCFIPPQESIEVIKFCSGLKAFIHNDTLPMKKKKKERKRKSSVSESEVEVVAEKDSSNVVKVDNAQKKRKYRSLGIGFTSSTPNEAKRIKKDVCRNATLVCYPQLPTKISEISSTSEQMTSSLQPLHTSSQCTTTVKETKLRKKPSLPVYEGDEENTVSKEHSSSKKDLLDESGINHTSCTLAEAKSTFSSASVSEVTTPASRPTSLSSSTLINGSKTSKKKKRSTKANNPFKNSISNTKHFYYDESGEVTTTNSPTSCSLDAKEKDVETNVQFHCALNDRDAKKPRIFQIQPNELGPKASDRSEIEIQENIILNPLDALTILNKSQIFLAPTQDEMHEEGPDKSSPDNSKQGQNSDDEGNGGSLNESINTACTTIDIYKETSMNVSVKLPINGVESSNIQTNQTIGDDISMNQTANSEDNDKLSMAKDVDESSVLSVDCVDLSVDLDDDDCKIKSNAKQFKEPQDVLNYDSSDVEEVSEVIDLNETEEAGNSSQSFERRSKRRNIKLRKIMAFCTKMTQLPEVGEVVVFKVPYVSSKGSTCSTEFLAGEVEYINKRTKSIKILILDGHSELCYVPGKYLNNQDDSICDQKCIQIKFSDMIDPKIWRKN